MTDTEREKNAKKVNGVMFDSNRAKLVGAKGNLTKQQRADARKATIDAMLSANDPKFIAEQTKIAVRDGDIDKMACIEKFCKIVGAHSDSDARVQNLHVESKDSKLEVSVTSVNPAEG